MINIITNSVAEGVALRAGQPALGNVPAPETPERVGSLSKTRHSCVVSQIITLQRYVCELTVNHYWQSPMPGTFTITLMVHRQGGGVENG